MKLIAHTLITLLTLTPAIPTYAMNTAGGKAEMDTREDEARRGKKRKHSETKNHICTICNKGFNTPSQLTNHIRTHNGEKPFICTEPGCGKSFAEKTTLIQHKRIHTGEKPFICTICNKGFSRNSTLTRHIKKHTGEKSYQCTEAGCGKSFAEKSTLTQHKRTHNGEKPFKCGVCNKGFTQDGNMKRHMQTHAAKQTKANLALSGLATPALAPSSAQVRSNKKRKTEKSQAAIAKAVAKNMKEYHPKEPVASDATVSSTSDMAPSSTFSSATLYLPAPVAESSARSTLPSIGQHTHSGVGEPSVDHAGATYSSLSANEDHIDVVIPPFSKEDYDDLFAPPAADSMPDEFFNGAPSMDERVDSPLAMPNFGLDVDPDALISTTNANDELTGYPKIKLDE